VATAGQQIENPVTGERIVFRITAEGSGGDLLELDDFYMRPGHRAAPHVHPGMEERFEVIEGAVGFLIDGEERHAGPGEVVTVPPGTPHVAWNAGDAPAHVRLQFRPALRWEHFVERIFGLAAEGRTDDHGVPELELLGPLLAEFADEIAPAPPPAAR
jgi:quercetin dioxygenase-like cupin family protein